MISLLNVNNRTLSWKDWIYADVKIHLQIPHWWQICGLWVKPKLELDTSLSQPKSKINNLSFWKVCTQISPMLSMEEIDVSRNTGTNACMCLNNNQIFWDLRAAMTICLFVYFLLYIDMDLCVCNKVEFKYKLKWMHSNPFQACSSRSFHGNPFVVGRSCQLQLMHADNYYCRFAK